MKEPMANNTEQPEPVTPGLSKAEIRQHAFEIFQDKLKHEPLSLEDWVLAEKHLVQSRQDEESAG